MSAPPFLERPVLQRGLWGVIGLCLLAGLVAVPTTGDDGAATGSVAAGGSTTTIADAGDGGDGAPAPGGDGGIVDIDPEAPAPDTTAVTPPAGRTPVTATPMQSAPGSPPTTGTSTTVAPLPPPEDLGTAQDPGATVPPKAGKYRYDATTPEGQRELTTTVEDRGSNDAGVNQVIAQRGSGFDVTSDVSWRKDGVYVLKSVFSVGSNRGECDWEPDFLQARLPLGKGVSWQSSSTCALTGLGPSPIPVKRTVDAKVVDLRRVRVAGRAVDVWVIEGTENTDIGGRTIRQEGTSLFSPKHGLVVSTSGKATAPDGKQGDYSTEIKNLDPE